MDLPDAASDSPQTLDQQTYRIGSDDVLEVMVWKNPDLSREVSVRPDGKFSLPLLGEVMASGRTVPEVTAEISERLQVYYKEPPKVSVIVQQVNSYAIYVMGSVGQPGKYVVKTGTTFLQALAIAGGFKEYAVPNKIVLRRHGTDGEEQAFQVRYKEVVVGRAKNVMMQPGDTVIVP
jgi:polysaccharide export outer membrane protein